MATTYPYLATHAAPGGPSRPGQYPTLPSLGRMGASASSAFRQGFITPDWRAGYGAQQRATEQANAGYLSPNPNVQVFTPQGGTAAYGTPASSRTVPLTPAEQQAAFTKTLLGDPTLAGQLGAHGSLVAQLGSQWQGSVLSPAQQALYQFGGQLPDAIVNQLKGIPGPTVQTPYGTFSLGQSLGDALSDPVAMANAQTNPYSTLNQIRTGYERQAGQALQPVYESVGRSAGEQNVLNDINQQEGLARYNAANTLLGQINQSLTGFDTQLSSASQTQAQAIQNAQQNLINQMNAGYIGFPTTRTVTTPAVHPQAQPYYRALTGAYGSKPLY